MMDKYIVTASLRADGSSKFEKITNMVFSQLLVLHGFFLMKILFLNFQQLKLRGGFGIIGNQEIPHNLHQRRQAYQGIG